MHIVASEDFQRNAIYSPDMLEMRLSAGASNTDRAAPIPMLSRSGTERLFG
jgi:hypothetical protein